jgi:hypothetical protein
MLACASPRAAKTGLDLFTSGAIFADLLILAFGFYIKRQVEHFIPYLRVREVVYVLETAHFASLNGIDLHREDFDPRRRAASGMT